MKIHGATDPGLVREHNEDAFLVAEGLVAVADGMGGHLAGEVASSYAIEVIRKALKKKVDLTSDGRLRGLFEAANRKIVRAATAREELSGMGTTLTVAVLSDGSVTIAHAGDSRAYLLSSEQLSRVTTDHSLVAELVTQGQITEAEAERHPMRSIITRALGVEDHIEVDISRRKVGPGDRLVLCSDGLNSVVSDGSIRVILSTASGPREACDDLIAAARAAGGPDNITVVAVHFD